jgi:hypothetical protein
MDILTSSALRMFSTLTVIVRLHSYTVVNSRFVKWGCSEALHSTESRAIAASVCASQRNDNGVAVQ